MSLISCASGVSTWRGCYYFLERRAKITKRINNVKYDGTVTGDNAAEYSGHIDLDHVRESCCNCPYIKSPLFLFPLGFTLTLMSLQTLPDRRPLPRLYFGLDDRSNTVTGAIHQVRINILFRE